MGKILKYTSIGLSSTVYRFADIKIEKRFLCVTQIEKRAYSKKKYVQ